MISKYSKNNIIIYTSKYGIVEEDITKNNISLHMTNIFESGKLEENSTVKKFLTPANDGKKYDYELMVN